MWQLLLPEWRADLRILFASLSVALAVRTFLVEPRFIPSLSMYPTLDIGDQFAVDKISRTWRDLERGDVVVFRPPPSFSQHVGGDSPEQALVKRIVAVEGDTVEMGSGGRLYINGALQAEPFVKEAATYRFAPVQVPSGCVFVLGDNRNLSMDSHVWGFLPAENVIGRATYKFWPPSRAGSLDAAV